MASGLRLISPKKVSSTPLVAAIAAYIGAGGLGVLISRGISQTDIRQLIAGAVGVSLLAIMVTVEAGDDLRTAVSKMFGHDVSWLPVVDGDGRFSGCVTQAGITHLLGRTYRAAQSREQGGGAA